MFFLTLSVFDKSINCAILLLKAVAAHQSEDDH